MGYPFFPLLNAPFRAADTWMCYVGPSVANWLRWTLTSREDSNFTYGLTDRCKVNLAASVSSILQVPNEDIVGYFREISPTKISNLTSFACGALTRSGIEPMNVN